MPLGSYVSSIVCTYPKTIGDLLLELAADASTEKEENEQNGRELGHGDHEKVMCPRQSQAMLEEQS